MSINQPQSSEDTIGTRHDRRRRETRERIAQAALALFGARGYDDVTIAEIAEAADVAKQTVVNHFPAKEDLLLAWHRPVEADVIDLIDQLPLSVSLPQFLAEELPNLFAALPEVSESGGRAAGDDRMAAVFAIIQRSPALLDALRRRGGRYQEDLAAILVDRVPASLGPVAARATAAYIMTTVSAMIEEANRMRGEGKSPQEISAALTDAVGRALAILRNGMVDPDGSPSE